MEATVCRGCLGSPGLAALPPLPHQFPGGRSLTNGTGPSPQALLWGSLASGTQRSRWSRSHIRAWLSALPSLVLPGLPGTERGPFPTAQLSGHFRASAVPCRWSVHSAWRLLPRLLPGAEVHAPYKGWLRHPSPRRPSLGLSHR